MVPKSLDGGKGGIADDMLDAAGILGSRCGIYAKAHEEIRKKSVPLIDLLGNLTPDLGKMERAVLIHGHKAAVSQKLHGAADGGLAIAHMLPDINGADMRIFLREQKNAFKIHFSRFLYGHKNAPFISSFI